MATMAIEATYELNGEKQKRLFEGKGTTHKVVKDYLRSLGAKKIKTKITRKITYAYCQESFDGGHSSHNSTVGIA